MKAIIIRIIIIIKIIKLDLKVFFFSLKKKVFFFNLVWIKLKLKNINYFGTLDADISIKIII